MTHTRQAYVHAVIRNYLRLPGTPLRESRRDRRLAADLHHRGIPLSAVWVAFVIAIARRTIRSDTQRKLEKIRTLHYFLPALDEALDTPLDPAYVHYLAARIRPFVAEKEKTLAAHQGDPQ